MLPWNDLQLLLALSRAPSMTSAATQLGVDQTTLGRRLASLEAVLDAKLVHRSRTGVQLTPLGSRVAAHAEEMARAAAAAFEVARGTDQQLAEFRERHPAIELELRAANSRADLTRPEVDLAIRVAPTRTPSLVMRRCGTAATALYGTRALVRRAGRAALEDLDVVGYGEGLASLPEAEWLERHAPRARRAVRLDSVLCVLEAAKGGLGLALLPCFVGDAEPTLERVPGMTPLEKPIWLVRNRQATNTARVIATWDFILSVLTREADALAGRGRASR